MQAGTAGHGGMGRSAPPPWLSRWAPPRPRPAGLAGALRGLPARPAEIAAMLLGEPSAQLFKWTVAETFPTTDFPDLLAWVMGAPGGGDTAADRRVSRFLEAVDRHLFPVDELMFDNYDVVNYIPFTRMGWTLEAIHQLSGRRLGLLMLLAVCQNPLDDEDEARWRVTLYQELFAQGVKPLSLMCTPDGGVEPERVRRNTDGTPFAAAVDMCAWLWASTGTVFLDLNDEDEGLMVYDWSRETVCELTEDWARARAILDRIWGLATWLEADPATRYDDLLVAVTGQYLLPLGWAPPRDAVEANERAVRRRAQGFDWSYGYGQELGSPFLATEDSPIEHLHDRATFLHLAATWLPEHLPTIVGDTYDDFDPREGASEKGRVARFVRFFSQARFPLAARETYADLVAQVPYARLNWWDRDEGLTGRGLGEALLLFLTAEVDGTTHWADLYADLEGRGIPTGLLEAVEPGGYLPADLRTALLGGPHEAAAWYCAWVWEDTGSVFLDVSDDVAGDRAFGWTDAAVAELERQWREAERILDGIAALEGWLEADSPRHFAALVAAISGGAIGQPEQEQGGAAG